MQNASQKKVNGDFSILNGDFSVQIFQKRFQLFFWKFSANCFPETFLHSEWRNLHSNGENPFTFFEKRFHHFFCWKCNWKTLQKNKCRFLHSEWRFQNVLNCLLKQIATEIVLHLKFRNLHSEWRFLHSNVFQKRFWFVFLKKHLQGIFSIQNGEISILNEDLSIHFFSEVVWTSKKISTENFSIQFFSEVFWTFFLKNKLHK